MKFKYSVVYRFLNAFYFLKEKQLQGLGHFGQNLFFSIQLLTCSKCPPCLHFIHTNASPLIFISEQEKQLIKNKTIPSIHTHSTVNVGNAHSLMFAPCFCLWWSACPKSSDRTLVSCFRPESCRNQLVYWCCRCISWWNNVTKVFSRWSVPDRIGLSSWNSPMLHLIAELANS